VVAVEGKGPRDPLDRPFGGRRLSAVEQGYRYATNLPCDWILVTNIAEIRLYHKGSDQRTYERFETARFATDEDHLRRFVYLLGAERVVPEVGENHLRDLLAASERAELDLTKQFYAAYAETRLDLLMLNDAPPKTGRRIVSEGRRIASNDPHLDRAFLRDVQIRAVDLDAYARRPPRRVRVEAVAR